MLGISSAGVPCTRGDPCAIATLAHPREVAVTGGRTSGGACQSAGSQAMLPCLEQDALCHGRATCGSWLLLLHACRSLQAPAAESRRVLPAQMALLHPRLLQSRRRRCCLDQSAACAVILQARWLSRYRCRRARAPAMQGRPALAAQMPHPHRHQQPLSRPLPAARRWLVSISILVSCSASATLQDTA